MRFWLDTGDDDDGIAKICWRMGQSHKCLLVPLLSLAQVRFSIALRSNISFLVCKAPAAARGMRSLRFHGQKAQSTGRGEEQNAVVQFASEELA